MTAQQPVQVVAAQKKGAATNAFIRFPWRIYQDDPNWVPPLLLERKSHFSAANHFFEHGEAQYWLAYRGEVPVGRICAQIDRLHLSHHDPETGFWGAIEAVDDQEVFAALTKVAGDWLRSRGMRRMLGPFNLNINQEVGLLVDGFDTPPRFMMGHARPYYDARLATCGFEKSMDVFAYSVPPNFVAPRSLPSLLAAYSEDIRVYPADRKNKAESLDILREIFNDAWSDNWSFVPFTKPEFDALGTDLMRLIPKEYVWLVDYRRKPAAFIIMLPDINHAIADLNGRLWPLGWAKLLWRLKVANCPQTRVPLMGVRKEFQRSRLGAALVFQVIDAVRWQAHKRGVREIELSWILETNVGMHSIIKAISGKQYKTYRFYHRDIPPE